MLNSSNWRRCYKTHPCPLLGGDIWVGKGTMAKFTCIYAALLNAILSDYGKYKDEGRISFSYFLHHTSCLIWEIYTFICVLLVWGFASPALNHNLFYLSHNVTCNTFAQSPIRHDTLSLFYSYFNWCRSFHIFTFIRDCFCQSWHFFCKVLSIRKCAADVLAPGFESFNFL